MTRTRPYLFNMRTEPRQAGPNAHRGSRILLVLAVLYPTLACPRTTSADQPPNVVLIMADDLGYGELGCYGQTAIRTPNLDALAQQGMRLTQYYSGSPVCAPSRCVLLTGKHTGHAYIRDNGDPKDLQHLKARFGWEFPGQHPIPDHEVTIAEQLKSHGYATGAMGKWGLGHFGTTGDPNQQGFDLFYGFNCQRHAHNHYPKFLWRNATKEMLPGNDRQLSGQTYSQDRFVDVAIEFIEAHQSRPFFLYLPFAIPHLSIQVPEASLAEYQGTIHEAPYEHRGYLKHPSPRAGYAAMITHMDRGIGKILERLEGLGLRDNTLVIFTSDNGPTYDRLGGSDSEYFNSARGLRGLKGSTYEGGIRVPFIASWPGRIPAGATTDHLAAAWDVFPTLCEAAQLGVPEGLDGISLWPLLRGGSPGHASRYLYWEFPSYGGQQAVREGDWKAVRMNISRGNRVLELYHLADDPGEQRDLAKQSPEKVAHMERLMEEAHTDSKLFPLGPR